MERWEHLFDAPAGDGGAQAEARVVEEAERYRAGSRILESGERDSIMEKIESGAWTQKEIAEHHSLSESMVSRIKNDQPEAPAEGFDIRRPVRIDPKVRHQDMASGPCDEPIDPWVPGDDPADAPRVFIR